MIEFKMGDWRTNASLLGLMNILDHVGKEYVFSQDGQILKVSKEVLEGFEIDYFKYFIDTYEKHLPWYRIASYNEKIKKYLSKLNEFSEENLKDLNKQIDLVKDYMRRPNYIKVYEFIDQNIDIVEKVKELKKINLKKKENVIDKIIDIENELRLLKEITDFVNTDKARDYMGAKGVIFSYINRGLSSGRSGISFLSQKPKINDIFIDYKEYFLDTLLKYNEENKDKYKYNCFSCNNPINNLKINMNLVKDTGFDQTRKSSYIWNHESDFAICNECLFLYSCLSAGFYYSLNEGIFINYNYDLEGLKKVNKSLKEHSLSEIGRPENAFSYRALINAINKEYSRHLEFEIRDMQIIRYKDGSYRFNLLSKEVLKIINESKEDLKAIEKAAYREGKENIFSIYDLVLDRVFNNQNLFSLAHFLIVSLISDRYGVDKYYNIYHISRVLNINSRIIKEESILVGGKNIGTLTNNSRNAGYYLRKNYMSFMADAKRVENRMKSITYKMTNALKTNNSGSFMDILINTYAYIGASIPMYLVEALKDNEKLRIVGYAFVAGINSFENDKEGVEDEK
ncbi:MAG: type I-B CRISPR-associated protein Cas8b1/Cst1 [Miniphocaeibacter sp.]|uniref:type I-B CRISPR-associated protein Cas8b1/Cst1 n=1 Tax=Miniphocaeibacter sp. TaxID=3100973 RepID=UPI003BB1526E